MDLQQGDEQQQLRDASRRLLAQRLAGVIDRLPEPPAPDPAQCVKDAVALGWLGLGLPEDLGGAGTFADLAIVHEELGRGLAPSLHTSLTVAGRLLLHAAPVSPLLAQLCLGELLVAPSPGSSTHRITGVVDAHAVTHLLVTSATELLLVAIDDAVITDDDPGCDIVTSTVVVTGGPTAVAPLTAEARSRVRLEATVLAAARALGGGRAVLERTVAHVTARHQFGRAIGSFQAVQHQLADVATALDAAELAVARAAWAVTSRTASDEPAATAGLAAAQAFQQATLVAHQLHGGMGFVLDSPLHLWSARAVADPTSPLSRRELLELRAAAITAPPHHRAAQELSSAS